MKFLISHFFSYPLISFLIRVMTANEMHYFSNLFDKVLYMFRTSPLPVIRSTLTLYSRNRYLSG